MNFLAPAALRRLVRRYVLKTAKSSMIPREASESGNSEATDSLSQVRRSPRAAHATHLKPLRKSEPARDPNTKALAQWGGEAAPFKGPHPRLASQTHDKQSSSSGIDFILPGRLRGQVRSWAETASPMPGGAP